MSLGVWLSAITDSLGVDGCSAPGAESSGPGRELAGSTKTEDVVTGVDVEHVAGNPASEVRA